METDIGYIGAGVLSPEDVRRARFGPDGWSDDIIASDPAEEGEGEPVDVVSDDSLDDTSAAELAALYTAHGEERCDHGSSNNCRKCGVTRLRGYVMSADGVTPVLNTDGSRKRLIAWKPIARPAVAPPVSRPALVGLPGGR